jgi:hypothetical protein
MLGHLEAELAQAKADLARAIATADEAECLCHTRNDIYGRVFEELKARVEALESGHTS